MGSLIEMGFNQTRRHSHIGGVSLEALSCLCIVASPTPLVLF